METGLTKNQVLTELSRSPHGALNEYVNVGLRAAETQPEFMAHLIAWDRMKGQVRDAKVALPIVSLLSKNYPEEFVENSLAHLARLGPRELERAVRFAKEAGLGRVGRMMTIWRLVAGYLSEKERNVPKWNRIALQHRKTLINLYCLAHVKPGAHAKSILFEKQYPAGSLFEKVAQLKTMSPAEAAGTIIENRIPFLVAFGALGEKAKDSDLVLALIQRMTPTELVTNTKMLERLGVKSNPALRGAFHGALEKASKSPANLLKTTQAAENIDDEELKENLRGLQEKQIAAFGGVEGNWLVLADKSGSMVKAIEIARHVSATLAKMVKGKVWLVFFDTTPQTIDVTGCALDVIKKATTHIQANGGTSIGCGLQRMLDEKAEVDGIAIVSDGGENQPPYFHDVYKRYSKFFDKEVPVYLYHCDGDGPQLIHSMKAAGIDMQVFGMHGNVDYYSLPNIVATMRTNRYSLIDEIMATRLLKLDDVFKGRARSAVA